MKKESKLSLKVASVVAASLAILGSVSIASAKKNFQTQSNEDVGISNKQVKPQLVLSNLNSELVDSSIQASHGSHSSHSSHSSHASHASHASSSI